MAIKSIKKSNFETKDTEVDILGTKYKVEYLPYDKEPEFKKSNAAGLCDKFKKRILVCIIDSYPDYNESDAEVKETFYKETIRHEVIHAYFNESGLWANANINNEPWAMNEEMIDWFAIQSPKIYKTFEELNIL